MLGFEGGWQGAERMGAEAATRRVLQDIRAYWEGLRRPEGLPRRADLDPRGMISALENVFLLEQVAPGHGRIRLAGLHLTDLLGMDPRGMPVTALFEPASRHRIATAMTDLFRGTAALELALEAERGIGRPALAAGMLILPILGPHGSPDMALGCLHAHGQIGRSPRRFAIARLLQERLAPASSPVTARDASPLPAPFGRPALRLVVSNP